MADLEYAEQSIIHVRLRSGEMKGFVEHDTLLYAKGARVAGLDRHGRHTKTRQLAVDRWKVPGPGP